MNAILEREQFLKERQTGIGGADASATLGLSSRQTALDLYLEKTGQVPPTPDNPYLKWGRLLEPVVRQEYAEQTGRVVRLPTDMLRHPKHPFMIGHPDGVTDDERLYEGKCARTSDGWGEPGTDQVPREYLIQTQHYLALTGFSVADIAVLIGGNDWRLYEVPADRELQQMIIDAEADFWDRLQRGIPPEPDWTSPLTADAISALYRGTNGKVIDATPALATWREVFDEANAKAKTYASAAEAAKAHILWEMGEAAVLRFSDGKALRRKLTKRKGYTVDATEFMDARFVNDKE